MATVAVGDEIKLFDRWFVSHPICVSVHFSDLFFCCANGDRDEWMVDLVVF
jgi:hypothetical protein